MPRTTKPRPKNKTSKKRSLKHAVLSMLKTKSRDAKKLITPMGGHLVNPPENCPWKRMAYDGGMWVDFTLCAGFCDNRNSCERYQWFTKATDMERAKDWKRAGVKCFSFGQYNDKNTR